MQGGGDSTDPYGYNGQQGYYTDHETGLILCTLRYYDPSSGRFLTQDPLGTAGGQNLYAYCHNDPINFSDPLGLYPSRIPSREKAEDGANAFGRWVDKVALGGSVQRAGGIWGCYDAGQASAWQVAYATADASINVANLVATLAGGVGLARSLGESAAGMIARRAGTQAEMALVKSSVAVEERSLAQLAKAEVFECPPGCFLLGTPVTTLDTEQSIEDVQASE